jgi:hypothetical protein
MSDSEKDELFWQESKGHQWSIWFASTQPTHRYNVLVIYEENAVETAVDRLEGMARGDNLEEIMSMLREGHAKEDVLSAVVEGRLGHEQPEESTRERNRKKEASEKQTFQCVMCKEIPRNPCDIRTYEITCR